MPQLAFVQQNYQNVRTMSELWERLRQARRYADMTQNDLSKLCGVSRGAVALWEAADPEHRTKPTTDHLIEVAKATGVPLEWLLNDASDINDIWRLGGEFGGRLSGVDGGPRVDDSQAAEVLPDLRQAGHVFVFANTPELLAKKIKQLANEPPETKKHYIYIGEPADVRFVATPADALSAVVEILTKT